MKLKCKKCGHLFPLKCYFLWEFKCDKCGVLHKLDRTFSACVGAVGIMIAGATKIMPPGWTKFFVGLFICALAALYFIVTGIYDKNVKAVENVKSDNQ